MTDAEKQAKVAAEANKTAHKWPSRPCARSWKISEKRLIDAREEFKVSKERLTQARQTVERLQRDCAKRFTATCRSFMLAASVHPARRLAEHSLACRRGMHRPAHQGQQPAGGTSGGWARPNRSCSTGSNWRCEGICAQAMERLQGDLPSDKEKIRQEHERLEGEEKVLQKSLESKNGELRTYEKRWNNWIATALEGLRRS